MVFRVSHMDRELDHKDGYWCVAKLSPVLLCATPQRGAHQVPLSLGLSSVNTGTGLLSTEELMFKLWCCGRRPSESFLTLYEIKPTIWKQPVLGISLDTDMSWAHISTRMKKYWKRPDGDWRRRRRTQGWWLMASLNSEWWVWAGSELNMIIGLAAMSIIKSKIEWLNKETTTQAPTSLLLIRMSFYLPAQGSTFTEKISFLLSGDRVRGLINN